MSIRPRPEQDVDSPGPRGRSGPSGPWVALPLAAPVTPGGWLRIRYRTGFLDEPGRPALRFRTSSGALVTEPLNGAVWGTGEWVGRVPEDTVSAEISPGGGDEPVAFDILSIEPVSMARLLRDGLGRDARRTLLALGIWLFADRPAAERLLKLVATTTPLDEYGAWRARRARPPDLSGFDAPRADWTRTPPVRLVASLRGATPEVFARTLASLKGQLYPRWSLSFTDENAADAVLAGVRDEAGRDRRVVAPGDDPAFLDQPNGDEWWGEIALGDTLPDHALAAVTEFAARAPWLEVVYGDEDFATPDGRLLAPRLKPDWSPHFFDARPYVGRLALVRARHLAALGLTPRDLADEPQSTLRPVLARARPDEVGHVRRILYHRVREKDSEPERPAKRSAPALHAAMAPAVSVIIPVRDRADLLERCARGLLERTEYGAMEVLIIDNGSQKPETLSLLKKLEADPRVSVMPRPGPFNYAGLCNAGAAATRGQLLLFLNSDIDVIGPDWLGHLAGWASRPEVGAVGAKLLYPNGTIQHAGVVVGLNGFAGHLYSGAPRHEPGHLGELTAPHEVSAVTGACLAVERQKFDAAGGFDAENLPVDLNDVDLCLRLGERGWRTIWTPDAELYHLESASRGRPIRGSKVYSKERAYFTRRWAHVIRDDPYYHPALSLVARRPVLG